MLRNVLTALPGGERTYAALSAEVRNADKTAIQRYPGKVCFRPETDLEHAIQRRNAAFCKQTFIEHPASRSHEGKLCGKNTQYL